MQIQVLISTCAFSSVRVFDFDSLPGPWPSLPASAFAPADILQVQGKYQNQPPFPWLPGVEVRILQQWARHCRLSQSSVRRLHFRIFSHS